MSTLSTSLISSVPSCGTHGCSLGGLPVQSSFSDVFEAVRAKPSCCRAAILEAIYLAEVEECTQAALNSIAVGLDDPKNIKIWNLDAQNEKILQNHLVDPAGKLPDSFFYNYGTTKSRIIFRLAPKQAKSRISSMDTRLRHHVLKIYDSMVVHSQVDDYSERFEKKTQSSLEERQNSSSHIEPCIGEAVLIAVAVQMATSKRKLKMPNEETPNQRRRLTSDDRNDQHYAPSSIASPYQADYEAPNTTKYYQENPRQSPPQPQHSSSEQIDEMMVLGADSDWFVDEDFCFQENSSARDGSINVG